MDVHTFSFFLLRDFAAFLFSAFLLTVTSAAQITIAQLSDTHIGEKKHAPHAADNLRQAGFFQALERRHVGVHEYPLVPIRQAGTPRIKAILTPEQLQKLAVIQQRMRDQQGTQQAPAQNPPPQNSAPPPQH